MIDAEPVQGKTWEDMVLGSRFRRPTRNTASSVSLNAAD